MAHDTYPLLIDSRRGSGDLVERIASIPGGPGAETCTLDYGDVMIVGDEGIQVGVEVKQLDDVLQCIQNGRFAGGQLIGMTQLYDVWALVIEGIFRMEPDTGVLQVYRWDKRGKRMEWRDAQTGTRRWMWRELCNWKASVRFRAGVHIDHTGTRAETIQLLLAWHAWFSDPLTGHRSVQVFDRSNAPTATTFHFPSLVEKIAADFDGVGPDKAASIARKFRTPREFFEATYDADNLVIKGKRRRPGEPGVAGVGIDLAEKIVSQMEKP